MSRNPTGYLNVGGFPVDMPQVMREMIATAHDSDLINISMTRKTMRLMADDIEYAIQHRVGRVGVDGKPVVPNDGRG